MTRKQKTKDECEDLRRSIEEALGTKLVAYRPKDEAVGVVGFHLIPNEEEKLVADWDQRTERSRAAYREHFETCSRCAERFNSALARRTIS